MEAEAGTAKLTFEGGTSVTVVECKLRGDHFVAVKGAKLQKLTWTQLVDLLAPHKTSDSFRQLRRAEPGSYLGLSKSKFHKQTGTFFMLNNDRSGSVAHVMKADPDFESRIVCVYRVEAAKWPVTLTEKKAAS